MNKKKALLDAYAFPESVALTNDYLDKFLLEDEEYTNMWQTLQTRLFDENLIFPEFVFRMNISLLPLKGGVVFSQREFEILKKCMKITKDTYFAIVEEFDEANPPHDSGPPLRFRYPSDLSWDEMNINDGISYELFQVPSRNFYVFGDSGFWGRYLVNDTLDPINLYGIHGSYYSYFQKYFHKSGQKEVIDWLPTSYKDYFLNQRK